MEEISASPALAHWLTCSSSYDSESARDKLNLGDWSKPIDASGFGCVAYHMHETGAKLYVPDPDTSCVIDVPGQVCEDWGHDWLGWSDRIGGRVTRIDLARDIGPTEAARKRMLQMRRAWFGKKVDTQIRTFQEHRSYGPNDGFTWYFGGNNSPLRLRVYDRRGPLRLEFQWRPSDREGILAGILRRDLNAAWRMLASRIIWSFSWYRRLIEGPISEFHVEKPETDWERAAAELKAQYGVTSWALCLLGIDPYQLQTAPNEDTNRHCLAKLLTWANQAGDQGTILRTAIDPLIQTRKARHGKRGPGQKTGYTPCQMGV